MKSINWVEFDRNLDWPVFSQLVKARVDGKTNGSEVSDRSLGWHEYQIPRENISREKVNDFFQKCGITPKENTFGESHASPTGSGFKWNVHIAEHKNGVPVPDKALIDAIENAATFMTIAGELEKKSLGTQSKGPLAVRASFNGGIEQVTKALKEQEIKFEIGKEKIEGDPDSFHRMTLLIAPESVKKLKGCAAICNQMKSAASRA